MGGVIVLSGLSLWNQITDNDINQMQGRREKLESILQERYGRTEQEARKEVDLWLEDTRLRLHNS